MSPGQCLHFDKMLKFKIDHLYLFETVSEAPVAHLGNNWPADLVVPSFSEKPRYSVINNWPADQVVPSFSDKPRYSVINNWPADLVVPSFISKAKIFSIEKGLLLRNFSFAISVSPHVCFILVLILISMFLRQCIYERQHSSTQTEQLSV